MLHPPDSEFVDASSRPNRKQSPSPSMISDQKTTIIMIVPVDHERQDILLPVRPSEK
jgi:hypothetical protein